MESIIADKMRERIRFPDIRENFVICGDVSLFMLAYNIRYGWVC